MSAPNVEDVYGLSPMQFGMLFDSLRDDDGVSPYQVQMVEKITGPLDDRCFLDAWQHLVDRHSILRSAFLWEEVSTPVQVVQRTAELPREALDWRGHDAGTQETMLRQLLADDWRTGFDLARPPLLRVRLVRTADETRTVVWSFHHLLLDGWSIQVLKQELFEIYQAAVHGKEPALAPAVPYVRYATWLHEQPAGPAREFWREYLRGISEPTELPVRYSTRRGVDEHVLVLDRERSTAVRRFAREQRVTVNTVVQGVWSALLSRYTGNDDVLYGATSSGRSIELAGVDSMVGLFINTLPVRSRVDGQAPVADWLRALQAEQIELRQWEHTSLVEVRECAGIPHSKPLFQSILVFENYPELAGPDDLGLRTVECVERTGYPLTVVVSAGEVLDVKFAYDRALFDAETIERLAGHFDALLTGFVTAPDLRLADVPMLGEDEWHRMVVEWNDTAGEFPSGRTIHDLLAERAAALPEAPAVRYGDVVLSHRELDARACRLAHYLRGRGVGPGVLVGVLLERGPDLVVTLLAVMKAGGAWVPLDPEYPADRLAYVVADTAAPLVVTQRSLAERLPAGAATVLVDEEWPLVAVCPDSAPESLVGAGDLAYVIYTSGSTGRPKGVMVEHEGVVNYLHWCAESYPAVGDVGSLLYSPVAFDLTVTALFLPLLQGLPIVIPVPEPGESAFGAATELLVSGASVSFLKLTPSHAELLAASAEGAEVTLDVRTMVLGGEELTADLARRILAVCGPDTVIFNEYGATECSVANVMSETRHVDDDATGGVSVGGPITNTTAYIVDKHDRPVPVGVAGEALLGGICVARGYLNREELTAQRFVELDLGEGPRRLYRTGDLCRWLPSGEMVFVGRIDDQVKLRGYRIELGEIEATLIDHPAVSAAAVMVREDVPGVKRLVAYVVGTDLPDADVLKTHAGRILPGYMVPNAVVPLEVLPLTPNGKVDRAALPAPTADLTHTPPATPTEQAVAGAYQDLLGLPAVGVHDNFFDLGGQSLLAIKLVTRLRRAGLRTTLRQVMANPSVHELAAALDRACGEQAGLVTEVRPSRPTDAELPALFCVHPGGGQIHSYHKLADALRGRYRLLGVQAAGLAEGEQPIDDVRAMAERYWKEIANVAPEGPYRLLGWSAGAVILHEMAAMYPDQVAAAYLLEPAVTGPAREDRFAELAELFSTAETLWRRGQTETGAARSATEHELKNLAGPMNIPVESANLDEWLPFNVLRAESRALGSYRAPTSTAPATLVVSDEIHRAGQELLPSGDRDEYLAHWRGRYPEGLRIVEMPGGHYDMIGTTGVSTVAAAIE